MRRPTISKGAGATRLSHLQVGPPRRLGPSRSLPQQLASQAHGPGAAWLQQGVGLGIIWVICQRQAEGHLQNHCSRRDILRDGQKVGVCLSEGQCGGLLKPAQTRPVGPVFQAPCETGRRAEAGSLLSGRRHCHSSMLEVTQLSLRPTATLKRHAAIDSSCRSRLNVLRSAMPSCISLASHAAMPHTCTPLAADDYCQKGSRLCHTPQQVRLTSSASRPRSPPSVSNTAKPPGFASSASPFTPAAPFEGNQTSSAAASTAEVPVNISQNLQICLRQPSAPASDYQAFTKTRSTPVDLQLYATAAREGQDCQRGHYT